MALGIPKSRSVSILNEIYRWFLNSGAEWTSERLADYKRLVTHWSSDDYSNKKFEFSSGVIALRSDGLPKGALANEIRRMWKDRSIYTTKLLTLLNGYSAFVSKRMTKKQEHKFFDSMMSSDKTGLDGKLQLVFETYGDEPCDPPSLVEYCCTDTRAPGLGLKTYPEREIFRSLDYALSSGLINPLLRWYPDIFEKVVPRIGSFATTSMFDHTATVGMISAIQQPGFKLRAVANPSRVIQAVLEPLKKRVMSELRKQPGDCTFDQRSGAVQAQEWLRQGKTIYSVDLSDATNTFPWGTQKDLLEKKFPRFADYIAIMDHVVKARWTCNLRKKGESVIFTRGQPLGLGPSFGTFALTHNTILRGIEQKLRDRGHQIEPTPYRILGDDIIICDELVFQNYVRTMTNLGCKFSAKKSMTSNVKCEFAGMLITKDRISESFKWRDISDRSALQFCTTYGKKALAQLNMRQRKIIKEIGSYPAPFGCGWSDGRTFRSFLESYEGALFTLFHMFSEEDITEVQDQRPLVRKMFLQANSLRFSPPPYREEAESYMRMYFNAELDDLNVPESRLIVDNYLDLPQKGQEWVKVYRESGDPRPNFLRTYQTFKRAILAPLTSPKLLSKKAPKILEMANALMTVWRSHNPYQPMTLFEQQIQTLFPPQEAIESKKLRMRR